MKVPAVVANLLSEVANIFPHPLAAAGWLLAAVVLAVLLVYTLQRLLGS